MNYIAQLDQRDTERAEEYKSEWEVAFRHQLNARTMLDSHGLKVDDLDRRFNLPRVGSVQVIGWKNRNRKYPLIVLNQAGRFLKLKPSQVPFAIERKLFPESADDREIEALFQTPEQRVEEQRLRNKLQAEKDSMEFEAAWS